MTVHHTRSEASSDMLQQLVEQLQAENAKLLDENSKLSKERNNMRVQCSYWKRKSSDLTEKVFEQHRMITDSEYIANSKRQRKDAQWRRLSICGGHRLASKRNSGHTSCTALAEVLDVQISRECIVSWELGLADSLIFRLGSGTNICNLVYMITTSKGL